MMTEEQAERLIAAARSIQGSLFMITLALGVVAGAIIGLH